MILSIDPGSSESAFTVLDETLKPIKFGKILNADLAILTPELMYDHKINNVAIEAIASYGMAVGKEVFDTCIWVGRFWEIALKRMDLNEVRLIYRKEEKMNLCHSMKAKDSNITQALVDRFASGQPNHGKGTKKAPGWFFGFSKDVWQSYAVGVTYYDLYVKPKSEKEG